LLFQQLLSGALWGQSVVTNHAGFPYTVPDCLLCCVAHHREAANAQRFAQLFAFMPEVKVPDMYLQHTTAKVLTMEWIEGERLRSASQQLSASRPSAAAAVHTAAAARSSSSRAAAAAAAEAAGGAGAVGVGGRRQLTPEAIEDLRLVEVGVRCSLEQMLEEVSLLACTPTLFDGGCIGCNMQIHMPQTLALAVSIRVACSEGP
jgi:hypothetical protein